MRNRAAARDDLITVSREHKRRSTQQSRNRQTNAATAHLLRSARRRRPGRSGRSSGSRNRSTRRRRCRTTSARNTQSRDMLRATNEQSNEYMDANQCANTCVTRHETNGVRFTPIARHRSTSRRNLSNRYRCKREKWRENAYRRRV